MLCDNLAHHLCTHFFPVADYGSSEEMDERSLNSFHLASGHTRAVSRMEGAGCISLHKLETPNGERTEAPNNLND
jgi:hypothetical protein